MKRTIKLFLIGLLRRLGDMRAVMIDWRDVGDLKHASDLLSVMRASRWMCPQEIELPREAKILVLAPHPDDEIIGAGGTLLKLRERGCQIRVVIFSKGPKTQQNRQEINKVASAMGFEVRNLDFTILHWPEDYKAFLPLVDEISEFRPDHLFLPFMLDDHPDHREVSKILHEILPQELAAGVNVWAYQVYGCLPLNAVVNIGDVIEKKIEILKFYESCFQTRDWAHYTRGLNAFNIRFLAKSNSDDYAEVFLYTSLSNYLRLCASYFSSVV